jgi:fatty acid-binding protein DegV
MRIGLVAGASCDLPDSYLERHGIRVLPSLLQLDGKTFLDDREPEQTMALYRRYLADRRVDAQAGACSADEIREIFLQELVLDYDRVLVITACTEFSDLYARATEASYAILQSYRARRTQGPGTGGFSLRVLDGGSIGAGEAVLVCRAVQLLEERQLRFAELRHQLREESIRVACLVVPGDPWYLRRRGLDGRGKGLRGAEYALTRAAGVRPLLSLAGGIRRVVARPRGFEAACAEALDQATRAITAGLGAPILSISFGGDPRVIRHMRAYQAIEALTAGARIDLHLAVMSATMGARLGPGALSLAWINPG